MSRYYYLSWLIFLIIICIFLFSKDAIQVPPLLVNKKSKSCDVEREQLRQKIWYTIIDFTGNGELFEIIQDDLEHLEISTLKDGMCNPFTLAAQHGYEDIVRYFIMHNVPIDSCDDTDTTALIAATIENHCTIVTLLCEHGADIHKKNSMGMDAILSTIFNWKKLKSEQKRKTVDAQEKMYKTITFLISRGARLDTVNCYGDTALSLIAELKDENLKQLIEKYL